MNKNSFFFAAAVVCLAVACNKNEVREVVQDEAPVVVTYIRAEGGESTKASVDGSTAAFTWNTGDKIAVYAGGYKISDGLADTYDATNSAVFSFSGANAVEENDRADFAIYPASLVWDGSAIFTNSAANHSSSFLTVTLPATYNLSDVVNELSPTPMIATNIKDGDLAFKSICALLRITVNNVPKQTRAITFDFNGKKVQGEFTLTGVDPGTTGVETSATDGSDDIITVLTPAISSFGALVVNIPVPAGVVSTGEYTDVTITTWDAASGGHKINAITTAVKSGGNWVPGRKASRKLTATPPVFSVSGGKKVVFAPGNLRATGVSKATEETPVGIPTSWTFAAHQYDMIGNANTTTYNNKFLQASTTTDLFSWVGESATYDSYGILYKNGNDASYHGNGSSDVLKTDWGELAIDDYPANTWRTPKLTDWQAVIQTRTAASKIVRATVNSVEGLIILPDNYAHPSGVAALEKVDDFTAANSTNNISLSDWEIMEAVGCVFLPYTGYRTFASGGSMYVSTPSSTGSKYWSCSVNSETKGGCLNIMPNNIFPWSSLERYYGCPVRLIRDVN